jgi:hypothetical protein
MQAKYYKLSLVEMDKMIGSLRDLEFIRHFIKDGTNWVNILNLVKPGAIFDNSFVVFYNEPINKWVERIIGKE